MQKYTLNTGKEHEHQQQKKKKQVTKENYEESI